MSNYDFGEKKEEFSAKQGRDVQVWISPRYMDARKKAIETLESDAFKGVLSVSDFWILMNETKSGKMGYTGLIISHNGCLKINDSLPDGKRFRPECMTLDKDGYHGSLIYSYCCPDQGIYEVGEVNADNLKKNPYPYAMALKRCMDRVILKNSKLAYDGIYSDSEAEEFSAAMPDETVKEDREEPPKRDPKPKTVPDFEAATPKGKETVAPEPEQAPGPKPEPMDRQEMLGIVEKLYKGVNLTNLLNHNGIETLDEIGQDALESLIAKLRKAGKIQ